MNREFVFEFKAKKYKVQLVAAHDEDLIALPNGPILWTLVWSESTPPKPLRFCLFAKKTERSWLFDETAKAMIPDAVEVV